VPSTLKPSQALREALETKLDTFEKLELVLLLLDAPRPLPELARELHIGEDVLRRVVSDLVRSKVAELRPDDTVHLTASDGERAAFREGAELYSHDRGKVIMLFSTIAMDRIRGMSARAFASAFNLRKKS
jgi:hypothetical protein